MSTTATNVRPVKFTSAQRRAINALREIRADGERSPKMSEPLQGAANAVLNAVSARTAPFVLSKGQTNAIVDQANRADFWVTADGRNLRALRNALSIATIGDKAF